MPMKVKQKQKKKTNIETKIGTIVRKAQKKSHIFCSCFFDIFGSRFWHLFCSKFNARPYKINVCYYEHNRRRLLYFFCFSVFVYVFTQFRNKKKTENKKEHIESKTQCPKQNKKQEYRSNKFEYPVTWMGGKEWNIEGSETYDSIDAFCGSSSSSAATACVKSPFLTLFFFVFYFFIFYFQIYVCLCIFATCNLLFLLFVFYFMRIFRFFFFFQFLKIWNS